MKGKLDIATHYAVCMLNGFTHEFTAESVHVDINTWQPGEIKITFVIKYDENQTASAEPTTTERA